MDAEPARLIIEALKEEKIDLYVTLPEEPTVSLTQAVQADPYFQCVTVASEDGGVALTAGASIAGRRAVFVTGIAGLLKGGLALMHMGPQYGIPVFILPRTAATSAIARESRARSSRCSAKWASPSYRRCAFPIRSSASGARSNARYAMRTSCAAPRTCPRCSS